MGYGLGYGQPESRARRWRKPEVRKRFDMPGIVLRDSGELFPVGARGRSKLRVESRCLLGSERPSLALEIQHTCEISRE